MDRGIVLFNNTFEAKMMYDSAENRISAREDKSCRIPIRIVNKEIDHTYKLVNY